MNELTKKFHEAMKSTGEEVNLDSTPLVWTEIFYKQYLRLPNLPLKPTITDGELENIINARKSSREFKDQPVSFSTLSNLLVYGLGKTNNNRRCYPSAGARYPIETYTVALNIEDLEPGIYHFDVKDGKLELLLRDNLKVFDNIIRPHIASPAALFIFTTVLSRAELKYGANAYRFSLLEAGHMVQNLALLCAKYNIGGCSTGGVIQDSIVEVLDLTSEELPIYGFACGHIEK